SSTSCRRRSASRPVSGASTPSTATTSSTRSSAPTPRISGGATSAWRRPRRRSATTAGSGSRLRRGLLDADRLDPAQLSDAALARVVEEHALEAPEGPLAVDGDHQPLAQGLLGHPGHESLHPLVLLAACGRLDTQEAVPAGLYLGALLGVVDRPLLHRHHVT